MVAAKVKQTKDIWIFVNPEILTQHNCHHLLMSTIEEVCITDGKYKNVFSIGTTTVKMAPVASLLGT